MTGNDGRTKIQLPDECPGPILTDIPPDSPGLSVPDDTREKLASAETEVRLLRERLADLTADRDALRDALARTASSHAEIVRPIGGFWSRLLNRN